MRLCRQDADGDLLIGVATPLDLVKDDPLSAGQPELFAYSHQSITS
jgi:hypothetical protein